MPIAGITPQTTFSVAGVTKNSSKAGILGLREQKILLGRGDYSIDQNQVLTIQDTHRFIQSNQDLLYVIDQSKEAKNTLSKKTVSSREDLAGVIAETAKSLLTGEAANTIDIKTLKKDARLSSLIVLNTAGIRDILNTDSEAVELFSKEAPSPEKIVFQKLGEETAALFNKANPLHDANFFADNPKVGIYLLKHSEVVKDLNDATDISFTKAKTFKSRIHSTDRETLYDDTASQVAADATNSGTYSQSYFANHVSLAEYVAAAEFTNASSPPADYLKKHPELAQDNISLNDRLNTTDLYNTLHALEARDRLSAHSPIPTSVLKLEQGLSSLILKNSSFAEKLNKKEFEKTLQVVTGGYTAQVHLSSKTNELIRNQYRSPYQNPKPGVSIVI